MNTQTSITDYDNLDMSELTKIGDETTAYARSCNIQISTNADKTRYLVTGALTINGNGSYSGNIKIPLNNEGIKTGKSLGSAIVLNPTSDNFAGSLKDFYFTSSATETHLLINIQNINLTSTRDALIYIPHCEVIYE